MITPNPSEPIFSAADVIALNQARGILPHRDAPRNAILCYQAHLFAYALKNHPTQKLGGFLGDMYVLSGSVAVAGNFGIGAPAAVAVLEELAAWGTQRFISIGLAGGLQDNLQAGDLVVCDRAIRDEGTSRHYVPDEKFSHASSTCLTQICRALDSRKQPHRVGASWTTDAPFRETRGEVEQYRQEGIVTVEMEAAALFTVGQYLKVEVGAAFSIADSLDGLRWRIDYDVGRARRGLQILFDAALDVFSETV